MSLSVKDAAEVAVGGACRSADGDVILEIEGIAREAVIRFVFSQAVAEGVPICLAFDPVLALQRNCVHRVGVYVTGIILIIFRKVQHQGSIVRKPVRRYRDVVFRKIDLIGLRVITGGIAEYPSRVIKTIVGNILTPAKAIAHIIIDADVEFVPAVGLQVFENILIMFIVNLCQLHRLALE